MNPELCNRTQMRPPQARFSAPSGLSVAEVPLSVLRRGNARFSETGSGRLGKSSAHGHNLFRLGDLQLAPPIFRTPARFSETGREQSSFFFKRPDSPLPLPLQNGLHLKTPDHFGMHRGNAPILGQTREKAFRGEIMPGLTSPQR
jgi:hypothetical protein